MTPNKRRLINIIAILIGIGIIVLLFNAPKPTTPFLPKDDIHKNYFNIPKKEAEKHCSNCHSKLSENHPPKFRCLFCHKRD